MHEGERFPMYGQDDCRVSEHGQETNDESIINTESISLLFN